jgi:hypothetical protein
MTSHQIKQLIIASQRPTAEDPTRYQMLECLAGGAFVPFESGDYIKFEIRDEKTGESEWMWLRVDYCDEANKVAFGWLDSPPVVFSANLKLGQHLAVSYDNIREHKKSHEF